MLSQQFYHPLLNWEKLYRGYMQRTQRERYDLRKDGNVGYSHPNGTHDDVFWSYFLYRADVELW